MNTVWTLAVLPLADGAPAPEEVKAGWGAFAIFLLLALAVVALGVSLSRHLKTAKQNFGVEDTGPAARRRSSGPTLR